nr:intrastrand cross-link recognition protein isoform X1 [Drosophila bipectinata]XP_017089817.2 intrastrand cross-link recognition protein isoform X1 [Drosophila bipectinata]
MSDSSTTPSPPEDSDSNERNSTSSQGSVSKELAHKIWRVTPNDLAQNIPALANSAYPCIGGVEWGSGGASSKNSANDSANAFISEVERALYGNSTGYPKNGSKNYFKAAENYAIYGDNFLDFPKDTSTCFAGLGSTGGSVSNAPPGFERSARLSALYERKQAPSQGPTPATLSGHHHPQHPQQSSQQQQRQSATDYNRNNHNTQTRNSGQSGGINEFPIPQICPQFISSPQPSRSNPKPQTHSRTLQPFGPSHSASQQHYQPQRGGGTASGYHSDPLSGYPPSNEINLSQLYQQLMARNLRPGHRHQHQHHQQQTNSNAAAAAMIYANLELQQQMQLRQLQMQQQHQHQQQQQQLHQQQARLPRAIYGGNNGHGSGGAATPTGGKEPPVGK